MMGGKPAPTMMDVETISINKQSCLPHLTVTLLTKLTINGLV